MPIRFRSAFPAPVLFFFFGLPGRTDTSKKEQGGGKLGSQLVG